MKNEYFVNWFKEFYEQEKESYESCLGAMPTKQEFKYVFLSENIFNLTTYDDGLSLKFGKKIYEVMKVIYERKNFDYNVREDNYINYILVCNLLKNFDLINWGTSIRGAWFDKNNITYNVDCKTLDGKVIYENPTISIKELIEWLENDGGNENE